MTINKLDIQTLTLLFLTSTFIVNANASDRYIFSGLTLSTANQLLPSSFDNRVMYRPTQQATSVESSRAHTVTEEIVVTAARIHPHEYNIAAPLQRLFNDIEYMKTQQKELEWLTTRSNKSRAQVKFGYDPKFEFHNRFTANLPGASAMERPTTSVLRLNF